MAVPKETHLETLTTAERILYRKLSDIKNTVECDGIIWQPPGWGMEYWKKGLRFRLASGGKPMHFKELDTDDLRTMMERFEKFVEYMKQQQALDISPPPAPPGPGAVHYVKYAMSKAYRHRITKERADVAKEARVREALEKLSVTREDARTKLDGLEVEEREIIRDGKAQQSKEIKRRLAGRLASLRKDISREESTVRFADRQIGQCKDVLHICKMARIAKTAGLPDADEIIANQVDAELAIEAADAASDATGSVEYDWLDEEAEACMKEFEEPEKDSEKEPEEPEKEPEPETEDVDSEDADAALAEFEADDPTDEKADEAKHTA